MRKEKHLDYIQDTILRMNSNSFMIKGWAITITSALFVLSPKDSNGIFFIFANIPIILFWILDGFFLSRERKYRALYDFVRLKKNKEIDFSMDISNFENGRNYWISSIFSKTLLPFYFSLIVGCILFFIYFLYIKPAYNCG